MKLKVLIAKINLITVMLCAMTLLIYDDIFLQHDTGYGHPENAKRLENTVSYLKESRLWEQLRVERPRALHLQKKLVWFIHKPILRPSSRSQIQVVVGWTAIR